MPAGPQPVGFAYFLAGKFVGYTAFCHWVIGPWVMRARGVSLPQVSISITSPDSFRSKPIVSSWKAGITRTAIGAVIGAIFGIGFWKIPYFSARDSLDTTLFFTFLVPVRIGEWYLLLRWLYWPTGLSRMRIAGLIAGATVVSFGVDIGGIIAAWILPGGMWVC